MQFGQLHFATENAIDSGRGVVTIGEIKSEHSEPACRRGHGGVCDRMVDSKQETGGYVRTSEAVQTLRQHMLTHRSILIHAMKLARDSTRGQSGLAP